MDSDGKVMNFAMGQVDSPSPMDHYMFDAGGLKLKRSRSQKHRLVQANSLKLISLGAGPKDSSGETLFTFESASKEVGSMVNVDGTRRPRACHNQEVMQH